ncbi:MAG: hydrogenase expression/formation protein HypE [Verrucomicrobiae bacterium]|nr:hydrogenase expression/formation protein HypE [Verrucomicrobiae bacterium]
MTKQDCVLLAHGGGGALMRQLIEGVFAKAFGLKELEDSAVVEVGGQRLAFTTDSYVVRPYFFPGGDIGKLAVCGTVNDLAVQGAEPLWMSVGMILEEGLSVADLEKVVASMKTTAEAVGVRIVTGDTKVVERNRCDGIYINTAGVGRVVADVGSTRVRPGDAVIVSGTLGEHGIAVLSRREGMAFETDVISDCAPLWSLVKSLFNSGAEIHAMRDPTRGGLAATVCDVAAAAAVGIRLRESALPISAEVRGACDLLGLDPLNIASEGKVVVFCRASDAAQVLETMRSHPLGRQAELIGEVTAKPEGMVLLETRIGGQRIVDLPTGEDLPRIC